MNNKLRYQAYLKSPKWRLKRVQKLNQVGNKCEKCGKKSTLEIHHLTYSRIYVEKLSDLKVLCKKCHDKAHKKITKEKAKKRKEFLKKKYK